MIERTTSVTFRGREVENPAGRKLVGGMAFISAIVGVLIVVGMFCLTVLLIPIWLPLHFLLRVFGRRGFIQTTRDDSTINFSFKLFSFEPFRKA